MSKTNKTDIYRVKCLTVTDGTNTKLKYEIDGINRLHSNCTDCDFEKLATIDEKYLNYLEELGIKKKLQYLLIKYRF